MNGTIWLKLDNKWLPLGPPSPCGWHLKTCRKLLANGEAQGFYIEGFSKYLNKYPFEIGDDNYPLSDDAETQIRQAMDCVSNHSERVVIASICAPQAKVIARRVLQEWEQTEKGTS